jgi:hypothetical protein
VGSSLLAALSYYTSTSLLSSQQNTMFHSEHADGILSGFLIARPFWRFKRWRELNIPPFNEVMWMITKPTDLIIMASRDAVSSRTPEKPFKCHLILPC